MLTTINESNEYNEYNESSNKSARSGTKSKKNKSVISSSNKTELWSLFESEVVNPDKQKDPLECLYRTIGDRENCEMCHASLAYADEGFLTFFFAPIIGALVSGSFNVVFPALVILQFISYIALFITQKERPDIKKNIRSMFKT